ncbi:MAG: hypothetical protein A3B37_02715 [Candidatus Sungbacteria bacterium RIFCSPLOWO2_01_FULL_59_16]|uniref:Cell shape-determining protein MreC n=1 Tax=Candidatus Sungbacteria bacterium RIFCSPLOWO2_01_FULL_59_16 TaxID=1802280 RepID=A0A1G2LD60_9BACT|nr:MAG: hypothetical protein A3B37_02715 [Candidatus Sungbacteria bacterium RIFCSPLOWO2_01_FULL_59_16]
MFRRVRILRTLSVAALVGLLVLAGAGAAFRSFRERVFGAGRPVLGLANRLTDGVQARFGLDSSGRAAAEAERVRLLAEIARLEEAGRENALLRAALGLREDGETGVLTATVIGFLREGRDEYLVLNRGTDAGIGIGDVVLDQNRAFGGTVSEVGRGFARVLLLSSPSRSVDVVVAGRELRAIAKGANARELSIELVPQGAELKSGDLLVAAPRAAGGRRALLVGEVREVREGESEVFKTVRAIHLFDPATDEVLVLLAP